MCGLSGIIERSQHGDSMLRQAFIAASARYLRERGPDAFAHKQVAPGVTFIHARLSIIDLALGGQPMLDAQGALIFNGELYNYAELKQPDAYYYTHSDTEVLLKGLYARGKAFLNDAEGMFAFAYYNAAKREILLARDLFGIKPMYYFFDGERFAFASRLQPLMLLSQKRINNQAIIDYYATRAMRAPHTIFSDIHELKAGQALTFNLDAFSITAVEDWTAPLRASRHVTDEAAAVDQLEQTMQRSIQRHLVADVPVATFLSGGVDSSLITAMAAKLRPDICAFSIGFTDPRYDETRYAASVCQRYGLRHHVRYCDAAEFMNYVDAWPTIMDDAVADPSAVMLTLLSDYARELGYKVILSGEGADELFAGYNQHYRFLLAKRLYRVGQYAPCLVGWIDRLKGQSRYSQFARHATRDPHFYGTGRIFEPYLLPGLLPMDKVELPKAGTLDQALQLDLDHRLPDDILTRTDRATMHASIEARVPFLTRAVWEVAGSLSDNLLIHKKVQKYALKKLAEKYVPHACLYRSKIGFDLPLANWLRGPLKTYMMDNLSHSWQGDYVRLDVMRNVVEDHLAGRNDNADKIWAFLLLENNVRHLRSITAESVMHGA